MSKKKHTSKILIHSDVFLKFMAPVGILSYRQNRFLNVKLMPLPITLLYFLKLAKLSLPEIFMDNH